VALLRSPLADAWLSDRRLARVHAHAMPNERAHYLGSSRGKASAARDFVIEGPIAAAH
jgi:hypothetical protein